MSAGIRVKDGESFERALRRFRKRVSKKGVLNNLRKHSHFERPSERKKRKRTAARRKLRKLKLKQKQEAQE